MPTRPYMDAMLMMRPNLLGIMYFFATERASLKVPKRSMLISLLNCSSVMSSAGATAPVPALFTVNSICPGYFYSPLTKETLDSEFFQANAKTMIPLERYGNEGELDTAICFLASPATTYVTGVNLPVDGGYTAM